MFRKSIVWIVGLRTVLEILPLVLLMQACVKEEVSEHNTHVRAPFRRYAVTARIDNKEAANDSKATGVLKGSYDESSKVLSYLVSYEGVLAKAVNFKQGARGTAGILLWKAEPNGDQATYNSPVSGRRTLTALQERNLLRGKWFITIDSEARSPEIKGIITLKQK